MSYAAFLEEGSGKIAVRVSIAGLRVEFVSEPAMAGATADGRTRIYCLPPMGEGIVFEERINIPEATGDVTSNRVTLRETDDNDLGQLFDSIAETETFLMGTVQQNGTQLEVMSESGFAAGDIVHLGTEAVLLSNVSGGLLHIQSRGYWDTQAQAHYSNDSSVGGGLRVVSSQPSRIRGRRLRVFMYGEGDDLTGDGTQVWLGRVTSDPTLGESGTTYSFGVDNVFAVLRNKLGSEMSAGAVPRGAYYHWAAPLTFEIVEIGAAFSRRTARTRFFGFYATQPEFVAAFSDAVQLAATSAGMSTAFAAIDTADGWTLQATIGADVEALDAMMQSPVDGKTDSTRWLDTEGSTIYGLDLVAGETYVVKWIEDATLPGARTVPRGIYGLPPNNFEVHEDHRDETFDETKREEFPDNRIYLGSPVSDDWTAVQISWPSDTTSGLGDTTDVIMRTSVTDNWIMPRERRFAPGIVYTSRTAPTIKFGRTIATGSLADFIAGLTHDAPRYANRLTLPAIWEDDFADILDIRAVIDQAAAGRAFLQSRIYTIFSPTEVDKLISHEARLLNCYPVLDDDGRITFKRFEVPNASTTEIEALDDEVWQQGALATLAPEEQGTYNVVSIKTGYNALENKHEGREFTVHDFRAFGEEQEQHILEIAPQSIAGTGDQVITDDDAASIGAVMLGYFSSPYKVIQGIAVTWQMFPLRCGDVVSITSQYLPAFDGLRPMSEVVGIIVSRRFALGEAYGTFDVIVSPQNVAGYAPAAYVNTGAFSNVAGNTWDITITTGRYAPAGFDEDEFFVAGDLVRLLQYDSETPTEYTGTVSSVNTTTHVIRVAFTGALTTPGNSEWWLIFQDYASLTSAQRVYCVIGENSGRIGDEARARTFAA